VRRAYPRIRSVLAGAGGPGGADLALAWVAGGGGGADAGGGGGGGEVPGAAAEDEEDGSGAGAAAAAAALAAALRGLPRPPRPAGERAARACAALQWWARERAYVRVPPPPPRAWPSDCAAAGGGGGGRRGECPMLPDGCCPLGIISRFAGRPGSARLGPARPGPARTGRLFGRSSASDSDPLSAPLSPCEMALSFVSLSLPRSRCCPLCVV
jgi:hypothetical protein